MIIKVCGMRDAVNIHNVSQLGVDWIGLNFCSSDERYVSQISSCAGIIPDYGTLKINTSESNRPKLCGIFKDDMPQNIVTRVYNFNLDIVQLDGDESPVMMDNLRRTLDPDIHAGIKIMKTINISTCEDINQYKPYAESADYFLFNIQSSDDGSKDWTILEAYNGNIPFLLSGNIGIDDIASINNFSHPQVYGINVDHKFEEEPAMKNINLLKTFLESIKR